MSDECPKKLNNVQEVDGTCECPACCAASELAPARGSVDCYEREWVITIKADTQRGAMDAVWQCWEAWKNGHEPMGGNMPRGMGDRMTYDVKRLKEPSPPNDKLTDAGTKRYELD